MRENNIKSQETTLIKFLPENHTVISYNIHS